MKKKQQVYYDKKIDALWIRMKEGAEEYAQEIAPGMSVEYDAKGNVIGVEVLHASRLFSSTRREDHIPSTIHQFV